MSESNNNDSFVQYAKDWIDNNPGKAIGVFAGLITGILLMTMGITETILIIIFTGIGYLFGRSRDENISVVDQITKFIKKDEPKE